jgi:hypothetical protein
MGIIDKIKELDLNLTKSEPRSGELYGVTALFDTPDEIIAAAEKVSGSGYKKFDVLTPYPLHGMDDAMKMKPTKIGWVALFAGITGTTIAFFMMWWMVGINYKNIFGGKPYFNIPPSIPIMFEVTVLIAALTVTAFMLAVYNKLPANTNPLHDTDFMKHVVSDKFGIYIEAKDSKFNEQEVKNLFGALGGKNIESVYYPVFDEGKTKTPVLDLRFMSIIVIVIVLTAAGTYLVLNKLIEEAQPFTWMSSQPKVLPQTTSTFFPDGYSMRNPVEGTVARGFIPYQFKGMPDSMVKNMVNPLPFTQEVIERGKKQFGINCSPCHGYYGRGDSRLHGQFPAPPSLHSEKVKNWPDGNIYHVITNGQNVMPSYERQVSRDDRWAIIHYIRVLQRSQNAPDGDLGSVPVDSTKTQVKTDSVKTEKK